MSTIQNNRWLSIITLALLVANIVTLVLLWSGRKNEHDSNRPAPRPGAVFEFLTRELQLNEQQQVAYRQLRDEHQATQRQMQDSSRLIKDAFFSLLQDPNIRDSVLQEYNRKAISFDQQMEMITFRHFQKVRALCNASQQKKFDALIKDVMRRMGGQRRRPPENASERPGNEDGPPGPHP